MDGYANMAVGIQYEYLRNHSNCVIRTKLKIIIDT